MAIVYEYISQKVLGFTTIEGARSNELGVIYLSRYPENYYSVSIRPVLCHRAIGRHFSACNAIDNYNRMRQSGVGIDKYRSNQSVYFRIAAKVELGMEITYWDLLFYHVISEQGKDNTISIR